MPGLSGRHDLLETKIHDFVVSRGGFVSEKTYHDGHIPTDIKNRISFLFTPTSLFLRAHADRWALMPNNLMFFFEAKTTGRKTDRLNDLLIEALPLSDHMMHAKRGVRCLYCCVIGTEEKNVGFWVDDPPEFSALFIPPQRNKELFEWYKFILPSMFPMIAPEQIVILPWNTYGSNDPFIRITYARAIELPNWADLIDKEITEFSEVKSFNVSPKRSLDDFDEWGDP